MPKGLLLHIKRTPFAGHMDFGESKIPTPHYLCNVEWGLQYGLLKVHFP